MQVRSQGAAVWEGEQSFALCLGCPQACVQGPPLVWDRAEMGEQGPSQEFLSTPLSPVGLHYERVLL